LKLEEDMAKAQGPRAPEFLPLINPQSKYSKKANFEKSQQQQSASLLSANKRITVELADLDWEDRETVLRLLFSKMNTGEPATCWRDPVGGSRQSQRDHRDDGQISGTSSGQQAQRHHEQMMNQGFEVDQNDEGLQYYDEEQDSNK